MVDAQRALARLSPVPLSTTLLCRMERNSASAMPVTSSGPPSSDRWGGTQVVFSGDLGRYGDPQMVDPVAVHEADYLLVESTYGDRRHDGRNPQQALAEIIERTVARGGTVVIPAFAVGRAQALRFDLERLKRPGDFAISRSSRTVPWLSMRARSCVGIWRISSCPRRLAGGPWGRPLRPDRGGVAGFNEDPTPKVIVSASGMATGGVCTT